MKKLFLFAICILTAFSVSANPIAPDGSYMPEHIRILYAMFLAGVVETFILWRFRYRGWKNLIYIFVVNLLSNYIVNQYYDYVLWRVQVIPIAILILETAAILFETLLLGIVLKYSKKLFGSVVLANIVSFFVGLVIFILLS